MRPIWAREGLPACRAYMGETLSQFSGGAGSSGFAPLTFSPRLSRSFRLGSMGALGDDVFVILAVA